LHPEQRLAAGQTDIVTTFRGGRTEPGPLSPGHEDDPDFPLPDSLHTRLFPLGNRRLCNLGVGGRSRVGRREGFERLFRFVLGGILFGVDGGLEDSVDTGDIDALDLAQEGGLLVLGELMVERQEVALTVFFEMCEGGFVRHNLESDWVWYVKLGLWKSCLAES
jgi:hypothetical protein